MSNKYKLIQTYPGSPKLGTIADNSDYNTRYYNIEVNGYKTAEVISSGLVEHNPEFWEKVEEKDYQIVVIKNKFSGNTLTSENLNIEHLYNKEEWNIEWTIESVKRISDGEIFSLGDSIKTEISDLYCSIYGFSIKDGKLQISHTHEYLLNKKYPETKHGQHLHLISKVEDRKEVMKRDDGFTVKHYKTDSGEVIESYKLYYHKSRCLEKEGYKIHSVKRNSDGEMFFLGDSVGHNTYKEMKGTIGSFYINKDGDCIVHDVKGFLGFSENINLIHKVEKQLPIFVTKDGVEMFEGDTFWKNNGWLEPKSFTAGKDKPYVLNDKPFSTKEKAEQHIFENKPCLSLKDIRDTLFTGISLTALERLEEIVKSKL